MEIERNGLKYSIEGEDEKAIAESVVICGEQGSVAETYAKENNIPFAESESFKNNKIGNRNQFSSIVAKRIKRIGNITYLVSGESVSVKKCEALTTGSLLIPSTVEGLPVTEIKKSAFDSCRLLTSVIIPSSVKTIGLSAFSGCLSLVNVTIPESVTEIGRFAFSRCQKLTVYCYKGSYAEKYATERGLRVIYCIDE